MEPRPGPFRACTGCLAEVASWDISRASFWSEQTLPPLALTYKHCRVEAGETKTELKRLQLILVAAADFPGARSFIPSLKRLIKDSYQRHRATLPCQYTDKLLLWAYALDGKQHAMFGSFFACLEALAECSPNPLSHSPWNAIFWCLANRSHHANWPAWIWQPGKLWWRTSPSWKMGIEGAVQRTHRCAISLFSMLVAERPMILFFWLRAPFGQYGPVAAFELYLYTAVNSRPGPGGSRTTASCQPEARRPRTISLRYSVGWQSVQWSASRPLMRAVNAQ